MISFAFSNRCINNRCWILSNRFGNRFINMDSGYKELLENTESTILENITVENTNDENIYYTI